MTLRRLSILYLIVLHAIPFAIAVYFNDILGYWFFAVEAALITSFIVGMRLVHRALEPLDFVRAFSDVLNEREFASRFSTVGLPEMDELIHTYNRMLESLYKERLRIGEQRGFVERFLGATPVGVLVLDFEERITLANAAAARFLERPLDSLDGRRIDQLEGDLACAIRDLPSGRAELVQIAGARRFRIERDAFLDRGFEREFIVIEELTAVLHESERAAYHKLIRLMSHEVNNTVASTNSLLESCTEFAPQLAETDRDDFLEAIGVVVRRNEHLNRFMRDFAQVVKLPAPDPRPTDLEALLDGLQLMFREECRARDIRWMRSGERRLPLISMDPEQMEQALINIIRNGIDAIDQGGTLELRTQILQGRVVLEIRDDGCGIAPDTQQELFTPFYSSKPNGQGLGLTLVKEILINHRFEFSLRSETDRTVFRIGFVPDRATAGQEPASA